eukprot:scaffold36364_cov133-Skeletonema_dohrnii-CCMP3373.AAC.1
MYFSTPACAFLLLSASGTSAFNQDTPKHKEEASASATTTTSRSGSLRAPRDLTATGAKTKN